MRQSNPLVLAAALGMMGVAAAAASKKPAIQDKPEPPSEIPDRVSLDPDSPFYFPHWRRIGVRYNGGECKTVTEFCVSEGWAAFQVFHGGRPAVRDGKPVTTVRRGTVEAYWRRKP